jgi:hypothetical protein
MQRSDDAIKVLRDWCDGLKLFGGLPAKGSIAAALHVLERLKLDFSLNLDSHRSENEGQVAGLSAKSIETLLATFGERRQLSSVGGRSNRGALPTAGTLLVAMQPLALDKLETDERIAILTDMQRHLVEAVVAKFFAAERVKAAFDPSANTASFIRAILANAEDASKSGPVAEHLVGAKLACLYPEKTIRNKSVTTSDAQGGHAGDFQIGQTVFHVTVRPMPELYSKLKKNCDHGLRVYLLVPQSQVVGAQQNATAVAGNGVAVEPIESFVATNIDELGHFEEHKIRTGIRALLETYNRRVDEVELDKSLLIEIPSNLPQAS